MLGRKAIGVNQMLDTLLLCWLLACCDFHKVEVPFARAVCLLESQGDPNMETQKVAGLFGLHKAYMKEHHGLTRAEVKNPFINIYFGVKAFAGTAGNEAKMIARLKTYNKTWWRDNYIPDLMATYRQFKRQR